jgi:3-dehydroquinate dehydratase / shikimate dehydrogenase
MSQLCLTLAEESVERLEEKIRRYDGLSPVLEIRLDYLEKPSLPRFSSSRSSRLIATCRPVREGGRFRGEESERLRLLREASLAGWDWIDVEHDTAVDLPPDAKVIRSYHDFQNMPADWQALYQRIESLPGDLTKIAVSVQNTEELVQLLKVMEAPSGRERIFIGMGSFGQPSRLLGHFLGNAWTYVVEDSRQMVAPGQFAFREAVEYYRLCDVTNKTTIYGVLGNPVAHSLSPPLHNLLFRHYRLPSVYLPFRLTSVDPWFSYLASSRLSFGGWSVTLPFKTAVVKYAETDLRLDALNTLVAAGRRWKGLNTDGAGFLKPLSQFELRGKQAVVLGAGGVVHTVVRALSDLGASVTIIARDPVRAAALAGQYRCKYGTFDDVPPGDLCVNCTPVGQYPDVSAVPLRADQLNFELVYDLIYHPEKTRLLRLAEKKGLRVISGMQMFVEQAALQFRAWTGIDPDRRLISDTVRSQLSDISH